MASPACSHSIPTFAHRRRLAGALGVAVAACAALLPTGSAAAAPLPAEVVSRTDGAAGWAPLQGPQNRIPGAISSDGRYAAFAWGGGAPGSGENSSAFFVRDIQANRTYEIVRNGYNRPTSIDRGNRLIAFVSDQRVTADDSDSTPDLYLLDIHTGQKALIARASGASGTPGSAADGMVSGDGRSVVFAGSVPGLGDGVFRRDLTTNTTAKIAAPLNQERGEKITSVSDDGRVVGTGTPIQEPQPVLGRVLTASGTVLATGQARVSPDGTTAAWVGQPTNELPKGSLVVRRLSTGVETVTALPDPQAGAPGWFSPQFAGVLWISPTGDQIAVAEDRLFAFPGTVAMPPVLYTRSSGTFAPIAGPFAAGLRSSQHAPHTAVSRTGRFALAFGPMWAGGLWTVDLWNQSLPGGTDPAPANEYIFNPGLNCDFDHQGRYRYMATGQLTPAWAEAAKSVRLRLVIDGKLLADTASTATTRPVIDVTNLDLQAAKSLTLSATVVTKSGKTIHGSWTEPVVPPSDLCPTDW